jgi:selenocysteine-specific translation elongation factor
MKLTFDLRSEHGAIVAIELIMQKTCGLVVVGKVTNSSISKGEKIGIQTGDKIALYDKIKRIEIYHEEVMTATTGQLVGICLENTSKTGLLQYLGKE